MKDEHPESEVFWCDVCPLYFGNDCELQFHIRGYHWNQMQLNYGIMYYIEIGGEEDYGMMN